MSIRSLAKVLDEVEDWLVALEKGWTGGPASAAVRAYARRHDFVAGMRQRTRWGHVTWTYRITDEGRRFLKDRG